MATLEQVALLQSDIKNVGLRISPEYTEYSFLKHLTNDEVNAIHNVIYDTEDLESVEVSLGNLRIKYMEVI